MRNSASTRTMVFFVMTLVMAVLVAWSWRQLGRQRTRVRDAAERLARCQNTAREIEFLRTRCQNEGRIAPAEFQYGMVLRSAATEARIPETSFPSPALGPEIHIEETKYYQQSIDSNLGVVSMPQCVSFLYHLASGDPPFHIQAIRLNAAKRGGQDPAVELWSPQINMTYLTVVDRNGR